MKSILLLIICAAVGACSTNHSTTYQHRLEVGVITPTFCAFKVGVKCLVVAEAKLEAK